eukprot:TRINITY_DN81368_c0_g1_i1.p1 TRINITY_DN81368_c0_g1~~TRINITY_DN81368_c0_g1_i1.p1  ORF type:complete len:119 (-),score=17.09 TRINITY_DN81368_c0_g1_i1:211-567(-)
MAKGRGHGLGPPHLRAWSELVKALKDSPGLPLDLSYAFAEHVAKYPDPVALAQVVKYFVARKHHDKATSAITVSVSDRIFDLWFSIKQLLFSRGTEQHIGPPPRGPFFRELLDEIRSV